MQLLELVAPQRRALGFTVEPMVAADRKLKPIDGSARTDLIRQGVAGRARAWAPVASIITRQAIQSLP